MEDIVMICYMLLVFLTFSYGLRPQSDHHRAFLGKLKNEYDDLSIEESIRRLRLLAPHVDMNKDGLVSAKELEVWIRDKFVSLLDSDDVDFKFRELDYYFDNHITLDEYITMHYGYHENATDGLTMEFKENFKDYVIRDKRRWKYADVDEDGTLNLEEFHMFYKPLKYAEMMDVVAMEEIEHLDKDKDGYISLEEYLESIGLPSLRGLDERKFHEQYDIDKDGKLNQEEVKIWKTPELFDKAELEAKNLIKIADIDKDGKLSTDEIVQHHFIFVGSKATISGSMLHDEF